MQTAWIVWVMENYEDGPHRGLVPQVFTSRRDAMQIAVERGEGSEVECFNPEAHAGLFCLDPGDFA